MISTYRTGNSKSPSAEYAEACGRVPWSRLAAADRHGLTKRQAVALDLNLDEWHHVSLHANRVEYFDPAIIARVLEGIATADAAKVANFRDGRIIGACDLDERLTAVGRVIEERVQREYECADWTR